MKAGIYIHIPFCKSKCSYCNFYSVASIARLDEFTDALCQELILRKDYLEGKNIQTIYWGGGTPSLLNRDHIQRITDTIYSNFEVEKDAEITIETNPDDFNSEMLDMWLKFGFNRLSIGTQSFEDQDLLFLKRRHDGQKSLNAIVQAQHAGFSNISIDLIFGIPHQSNESIIEFINKAVLLQIPHISAYALTVESNTPLDLSVRSGKIAPPLEEQVASQFLLISDTLEKHGFEHYEISNYAIPGFQSKHNSNYWNGSFYLGVGPSAHSFNRISRQWNVSSLPKYINSISDRIIPCEVEILSEIQKYNEYVMTSLRTRNGIEIEYIRRRFGDDVYSEFIRLAEGLSDKSGIQNEGSFLRLTRQGMLFADRIASDLFIEE